MFCRRNLIVLTLLLTVAFYMVPQYEAEAIDPVTIAILAPIAIQGAKIVAPYVIRGLGNMGKFLIQASKHLVQTILLPVGLFEVTFLAPWRFKAGLKHLGKGLLGPLKFCGYMLL